MTELNNDDLKDFLIGRNSQESKPEQKQRCQRIKLINSSKLLCYFYYRKHLPIQMGSCF